MSRRTHVALSYCLPCLFLVGLLACPVFAGGRRPPADSISAESLAQKLTQGNPPQALTEQLTAQYRTNQKVVDVIFGEAKVTVGEARTLGVKDLEARSPKDTVKIQYPKVVMLADEQDSTEGTSYIKSIRFLNAKGVTKKEVPTLKMIPGERWSSVTISKGRKFIGVNSVIEYSRENVRDADFIMFDDEGRELWKMKHHLTHIIPSPNGEYTLGIPDPAIGDAPIYMYDAKGLVREIRKDNRSWDVDFSKDGSYFAVKMVTVKQEGEADRKVLEAAAHLIVFDSRGKELWRKENITSGPASFACRVKISDADVITVITGVGEYRILTFDKNGKLLQERQGDLEALRRFKQE